MRGGIYRLVEFCIWLCLAELAFYGLLAFRLAFQEHRLGMLWLALAALVPVTVVALFAYWERRS